MVGNLPKARQDGGARCGIVTFVQLPTASRPYMPGYGILGPKEGSGLLPWAWAEERLAVAHDYWVASVWPDGRPHVMPVWGTWFDTSLWFSSSRRSRKVRNLRHDPRCVVTTDNAIEPVVIEGVAVVVSDLSVIASFLDASNSKYATGYGIDFLDPAVNSTIRVHPLWVFGLDEGDFTGSPTSWRFDAHPTDR